VAGASKASAWVVVGERIYRVKLKHAHVIATPLAPQGLAAAAPLTRFSQVVVDEIASPDDALSVEAAAARQSGRRMSRSRSFWETEGAGDSSATA